MSIEFDVFISHAAEDKETVARPLSDQLTRRGLRVWLDEAELRLGDSLRRKIDQGLSRSRYGIVVLSPDFLRKEWPQKELDALVAREDGSGKVVLPVWHNVNRADILAYSPLLADKLAAPTSKGLQYVVEAVVRAVASADEADEAAQQGSEERAHSQTMDRLLLQLADNITKSSATNVPQTTGVRTGFYDLDRMVGGLQPGCFVIFAGRPALGKTAFALSVAEHVACSEGLPVLLFTRGASAAQVTGRMVCLIGRMHASDLRGGGLDESKHTAVRDAFERLSSAPIHIADPPDLTVEDVQVESRRVARLRGALGLVVIDPLQLLEDPTGRNMRDVCRKLKGLARELNCPVLGISSLPRDVDTRADKRPVLSDLKVLDDGERYADLVMFLYREDFYKPNTRERGMAEIIIATQRDGGPVGVVRLAFKGGWGRFENIGTD